MMRAVAGHNSASFGEALVSVEITPTSTSTKSPKKRFPYFKFYPRDWIEATRDMTLEARGAYIDLICLIMEMEGHLTDNDGWISHQMHVSTRKWRTVKKQLVEHEKIRVEGGMIINDRCLKELDTLMAQRRNIAESASNRERNKREKEEKPLENNDVDTTAVVQSSTYLDRDRDKEEETSLRSVPADAGLDASEIVWGRGVAWLAEASGISTKKLKPIVGKWLKVLTFDELLHAMRSAAKVKTGDPISYIGSFVASAKQAEHSVRRENGRLVVMNGFKAELEQILAGRDFQRALDQLAGKIPIGLSGIELETRVRGMAIEMVERVADQDRRYAAAVTTKTGGMTLL